MAVLNNRKVYLGDTLLSGGGSGHWTFGNRGVCVSKKFTIINWCLGCVIYATTRRQGFFTYCSSYGTFSKSIISTGTTATDYCQVDGGVFSWLATDTQCAFLEGANHTWTAIGYE